MQKKTTAIKYFYINALIFLLKMCAFNALLNIINYFFNY